MISSENIIKMAQKWKNSGVIQRKRIGSPGGYWSLKKENQVVADKGHFVVYSRDQIRFMIPLKYLKNKVFSELLKMSEEEFGLAGEQPITLPLEALLMEYIIFLIAQGTSQELENVLNTSFVGSSSTASSCIFDEQRINTVLGCSH